MGLGERCEHRRPSSRAASASVWPLPARLVSQPDCVLADEPTGNLDRSTAVQVFALMLELARHQGTAFVLVTHDQGVAARCDRVLHSGAGKIALNKSCCACLIRLIG